MLFLVVMAACGNDTTTTKETKKETEPAQTETKTADTEKESEPSAEETNASDQEFEVPGLGHMKTIGIGYNDEVGIDGTDAPLKPIEMGSLKLTINALAVYDVKPEEDMKFFFNNQDEARVIAINMEAENTSDEDINFNPNQAILVTDTGEQLDAEIGMMGEAGGDFLGKVKKSGQSTWIVKNMDKDIKKVTMIISSPYKVDGFANTAEEKRIVFDVLTWEEALKKDGKK
jgi:Domain of unknown function (DUF4352)